MNRTASAMSSPRTKAASVVTGRALTTTGAGRRAESVIADSRADPGLQEVDEEKESEGDHQHGRRHGSRAGVVELLQADDDEERRDLRDVGDVAGDEDDRAVLADGAGESEGKAGEDRRHQARQHDAIDRLAAFGAEGSGGLLGFAVEVIEHRLDGSHD